METKSNYVIVGIVTFILMGLLLVFTVWIARFSDGEKKEYDIFFRNVAGVNKGASVSYSGISVGQVSDIGLWNDDPEFIRVRISVDEEVPILEGTIATISGVGFTGVYELQLSGGLKGAEPISCPREKPKTVCPEGVPIIPTKPGAFGELLNTAPLLLERLATLAERLTSVLSDENQKSLENIFTNVDRLTGALANQTPEIKASIVQSKKTLVKANETLIQAEQTLQKISALTDETGSFINGDAKALVKDLTATLKIARGSLRAIETTVNNTNPAIETINTQTIPEANKLLRDLQQLSASLKSVSDKLDQQGAGALLGPPPLPDYEPK